MQKIKYYQPEFLDQMRIQTDHVADQAVASIFESGQPALFRKLINELKTNSYQIPSSLPEEVKLFLNDSRKLPVWADRKMVELGQDFFKKHASSLTLMLGLLSLPYDYAAANGAQVLLLSERMQYDTGKRLAETGRYVFDVASPGSFSQEGSAIASAQKVRLVHASIRYHIKKMGSWNKQWGQAINQEDMAGTNLSMSLMPVRGMRKLGIEVSQKESLAYIHLWNLASYCMGVDERLLPDTSKEAFVLNKMIAERQFRQSEAGVLLTKALLNYIHDNSPARLQWLAPKYMRFLLGDKVSDILDIPKSALFEAWLLNPLKYWNQTKNILQRSGDTFYDARTMYRKNTKKVLSNQEVLISLPKGLKTSNKLI
ncbi:oxygenase MpaB family protein [Catalinimonas niigatensis]|uniref:oxygenase MpaB family protein n=1 Tax=Catalinimonas niigatensis TaxID=1397264 RepID=UPI002666F1CF|nr:oxygenase MpaB family protein [Catalinimonas niigatensis]WPP51151.1 oxygenase MpaB family protein [Catalinimonas niigatensis]